MAQCSPLPRDPIIGVGVRSCDCFASPMYPVSQLSSPLRPDLVPVHSIYCGGMRRKPLEIVSSDCSGRSSEPVGPLREPGQAVHYIVHTYDFSMALYHFRPRSDVQCSHHDFSDQGQVRILADHHPQGCRHLQINHRQIRQI
jgi:hypothetical protein